LRANGNGSLDLVRVMELASLAGRLHPEFNVSTLVRALGGYLLSDQGKPVRNQILSAGTQWAVGGIVSALSRLARPAPPPTETVLITEGES
jgi:hypothetical protein